jgi:hypothetical protein
MEIETQFSKTLGYSKSSIRGKSVVINADIKKVENPQKKKIYLLLHVEELENKNKLNPKLV